MHSFHRTVNNCGLEGYVGAGLLRPVPAVIVVLFCMIGTAPLHGQDLPESPRAYVTLPVEGDFEDLIEDMLHKVKQEQEFQEYVKKLTEQLKQAKELNIDKKDLEGFDFDDPLIKKRIQKMWKDSAIKDLKLDQKKRKQIEDVLKKFEAEVSEKKNEVPPAPPIEPPANGEAPPQPPTTVTKTGVENADSPQPGQEDALEKWFGELIDRETTSKLGRILLESESVQKALLEINGYLPIEQQNRFGLESEQMNEWLELLPEFEWDESWLRQSGMKLGNVRLPSMPRVRVNMSGVDVPSGALGGPSGDGFVELIVFVAALIFGCGLVIAFLLRGGAAEEDQQSQRVWKLGRWPLNPAKVSTRGELVQAFNYLALLLFGQPAMHWNHRTIADRIASDPSERWARRRDAMADLARMYEQARYAPADELISRDDLQRCRQYLISLAGAANG